MTRQGSDKHTRVWFVTCASSGFGCALSLAVLENGERLVATARDPERSAPRASCV